MRKWIAIAAAIVVVAALAFAWNAQRKQEAAELDLGLQSARVLSQTFEQANALKVSTVSGELVARSRDEGVFSALDVEQTVRAPFSADYFIEMSEITTGDLSWNPEEKVMVIAIPEPTVAPPNIDLSKAQVRQSGIWVSRAAGIRLQQKSSKVLSAKAQEVADSPENFIKAREAAREAIRKNAQVPLAAAGIDDVTVDIRFRSELNDNDDVWDYTLPYEEVLRRRQAMD